MAVIQNPNKRRRPSPTKVKRGKMVKIETHESKPAHPEMPIANIDSQSSAFERAKEVQENLSLEFPSFIKSMLPSHVTGGFWLGLPRKFCDLHLPKSETIIVLEDESEKEYETKYLPSKTGLSGGWRGFSMAHNLLEGDVLVFHLVKPTKFKVYILRNYGSNEVDIALSLLNLESRMKHHDSENDPNNVQMICDAIANQPEEKTIEEEEDLMSEILGGIRLSESTITFQEITSIENFSIIVNGLVIDSELSQHLKTKYYELCCSQRMFLHENLLEGLNCKLVSGIICETINIADAIRSSKITNPLDSFAIWHKTLKAFEAMGMNIGFLLARLDQLMSLASKSQRYDEARLERDRAEDERKVLEARIVEVKETIERLNVEIDNQNLKFEKLEVVFQELAKSPW